MGMGASTRTDGCSRESITRREIPRSETLMSPKELVAQFIEEKLEGDINRLATFPRSKGRRE